MKAILYDQNKLPYSKQAGVWSCAGQSARLYSDPESVLGMTGASEAGMLHDQATFSSPSIASAHDHI